MLSKIEFINNFSAIHWDSFGKTLKNSFMITAISVIITFILFGMTKLLSIFVGA